MTAQIEINAIGKYKGIDNRIIVLEKKSGEFRGAIPAAATSGHYVHYYIEARDLRGRLAAGNGSAKSPNVIMIEK